MSGLKRSGRSYVRFSVQEEKLIFARVERGKVDFFLVIMVRLVWKGNLGREARTGKGNGRARGWIRENEDGFTIQLWVRYRWCSLLSRAGPAHSPNKAWRHDTGRPRPKPNTHFLLGTMKDQVVAVAPMPVRYRPIIILLLSADHTLLLARLITSYRKSGIQVDLIPGHMTYQHSAVTVTVQVVVLAWRQVKKERLWQRREHNDRKPPQRWPSSVLQVQHHSWISYAVASSLYIFALFQQYQTMHIYSYVRTS